MLRWDCLPEWLSEPCIFIVWFHLYHVLDCKYKSFHGRIFLVFDNNDHLVYITLDQINESSKIFMYEGNTQEPVLPQLPSLLRRCNHSDQGGEIGRLAYRTSCDAQINRRDRSDEHIIWCEWLPQLFGCSDLEMYSCYSRSALLNSVSPRTVSIGEVRNGRMTAIIELTIESKWCSFACHLT